MNIEVGDYIRTKKNGIKKVIRINEKATKNKYVVYYGIDKEGDKTYITINIDDIITSSKYLLDILEEGDFCNNELIKVIFKYKDKSKIPYIKTETKTICEFKIDTVLTHEQYEQNCYKVEA